jgi:hypothetical protein
MFKYGESWSLHANPCHSTDQRNTQDYGYSRQRKESNARIQNSTPWLCTVMIQ